jgi:hypothetical protein
MWRNRTNRCGTTLTFHDNKIYVISLVQNLQKHAQVELGLVPLLNQSIILKQLTY